MRLIEPVSQSNLSILDRPSGLSRSDPSFLNLKRELPFSFDSLYEPPGSLSQQDRTGPRKQIGILSDLRTEGPEHPNIVGSRCF